MMKERIKTLGGRLERDHFGKEAIELERKIQGTNEEEEPTNEELDIDVVFEAASEDDNNIEMNTLPAPAICAKASEKEEEQWVSKEKRRKENEEEEEQHKKEEHESGKRKEDCERLREFGKKEDREERHGIKANKSNG
uniref:Uncharacterized protein n=1 Tax=Romanomermis culicivorax TaxID=13658 RepID=A0A915K8P8_ROMCU